MLPIEKFDSTPTIQCIPDHLFPKLMCRAGLEHSFQLFLLRNWSRMHAQSLKKNSIMRLIQAALAVWTKWMNTKAYKSVSQPTPAPLLLGLLLSHLCVVWFLTPLGVDNVGYGPDRLQERKSHVKNSNFECEKSRFFCYFFNLRSRKVRGSETSILNSMLILINSLLRIQYGFYSEVKVCMQGWNSWFEIRKEDPSRCRCSRYRHVAHDSLRNVREFLVELGQGDFSASDLRVWLRRFFLSTLNLDSCVPVFSPNCFF